MLSLQNILNAEGQEFLENLLNKEVIVNEKLNAATLSFQKKASSETDLNRKLTFYKGSGNNKREITIADKVMTTFYKNGMTYLNNLSNLIIDKIPANWTFVCKYFPNHQPSFINYSVLPKNNLVLSCIITTSGTKIDDCDDLRTWAEMFDIAYQEPVFRGFLSEYQKERLHDYIKDNTSNKESFARFVITLLNPSLKHSLYQNDGFNSPIDGFIFKFISDDGITKPISAKLLDPYMSNIISKKKSMKGYKDNTDVLLSDFTVFMTNQDLDSIVLTSKSEDDRYLELFYRLFNRYIKYKKSQLEDFDVDTNDIVKESIDTDFGIDFNKISNETTKKLLKENPEFKSIFKTLLGSFRTKKPEDYKSIVMSPGIVRLFNKIIDNISQKISKSERCGNLSFSSYLETIKNKDLNDLDIKNAPTDVQKSIEFEPTMEPEHLNIDALSFADFKKKEEKEEKKKEEKHNIKSIEDMIKDLQKSVKNLSDKVDSVDKSEDNVEKEIKEISDKTDDYNKSDEKSDKKDSEKSDEKSDKKDSEKSDEKSDKKDSEKSDKNSDKKDSEKSDEDDSKDEENDNESSENKKEDKKDDGNNPLSSL